MKDLKLTTWDRIQLVRCIPSQGTITDIAKYLRLTDVLELNESESVEVGLQEFSTPGPAGVLTRYEWVDQEREFDLILEDADFTLLYRLATQHKNWPRSHLTIELQTKLKQI